MSNLRESCPTCGTVYLSGEDDNEDEWRTLCPCESVFHCCKGAHKATHARYINKKISYWCNKCGVAEAVPPPPPKVEEPVHEVAPKREKPPKREREADPKLDVRLPETIKLLYDHHTYLVKCDCGDTHRFCDRIPLPRFDIPDAVPRMCCPKCNGGYPEVKYKEVRT